METRPQSPQPPGVPRWVAMFHEPSSDTWRPGAESPDRSPVLYAIGEMSQVMRARGDEVRVALWGPKDGAWHHFDASAPDTAAAAGPAEAHPPAAPGAQEPTKLAERMHDRRHQVLMAGLSKAGLYDLTPDDVTTVQTLVDQLDEATLRRVAHWMAVAGTGR